MPQLPPLQITTMEMLRYKGIYIRVEDSIFSDGHYSLVCTECQKIIAIIPKWRLDQNRENYLQDFFDYLLKSCPSTIEHLEEHRFVFLHPHRRNNIPKLRLIRND